jgi:hypothetical protein
MTRPGKECSTSSRCIEPGRHLFESSGRTADVLSPNATPSQAERTHELAGQLAGFAEAGRVPRRRQHQHQRRNTRGGAAVPGHRRAFDSSRRTEPDRRRPSVIICVSSMRIVLRSSRANDKRSTRRTDASAAGADGDAVSDGGRGGRGG